MLDTQDPHQGIRPDAEPGPYMRLTDDALARAKTKLGVDAVDELSKRLGLANRMSLWRLRRGLYDIRLSQATAIAEQLGWPLSKVFTKDTAGDKAA